MSDHKIHWGSVIKMVAAGIAFFAFIIFLHYYDGIPADLVTGGGLVLVAGILLLVLLVNFVRDAVISFSRWSKVHRHQTLLLQDQRRISRGYAIRRR